MVLNEVGIKGENVAHNACCAMMSVCVAHVLCVYPV